MVSLAGHSIKGYTLLERIGAGGYGVVYRAYQSTVGREVAVKVILPGYANKPVFIRRFEAEAQLVARLEHLHIVPLYDYWRDPGGAYLVMRWLRGGSLREALQDGPYDLESAAILLDQIASGLSSAHSMGVIHRDLKPSNILLDEEGNAYIADFGIAKILRDNGNGIQEEEAAGGFPEAISPEEASGDRVTPQTDIYCLGVLLYETLTGQHPFPEATSVQRLYRHLNDPLPQIESLNHALLADINQVIQKATAKNPKSRFRDALEMAVAFRQAARMDSEIPSLDDALTPREEDILQRIVDGMSNKEIAQELFIELTTVKWYITQIYRKLGVRSRKQAIKRALKASLLSADEEIAIELESPRPALPEPVNPYKGLRAFDTSDARDFFGREELIEKLLARQATASTPSTSKQDRLRQDTGRFLAIVGPSGSGKSSLVKAGLIPAILRGDVPGSENWFFVQFVPGRQPLDQLEIALTRIAADQSPNLRQHLDRDAYGLQRAAELILPRNDSELLIVIDQFEEVFTLVEDEALRSHVLALLSRAVEDPHSRVRIILTLRADYYDRPLQYPDFGELLRNHMETILPLSVSELERAILRPSEQVGVSFEPGLLATIIEDVKYQPGALPLLQYALTELFEERDERTLTHAAYQNIGGTAGALARRAEELYQMQDAQGREAIHQIFLRLVAFDEAAAALPGSRRTAPRSELTAVVQDEDLADEIIDTYVAYRLLTLDHDAGSRRPTVEIAHEALLREWKRLRYWLEESRADLRMQRQLAQAAEGWRQSGEDASFALRGTRLKQFEAWSQETELALTAEEREYLQASTRLRDEEAKAEFNRQAQVAALERRTRRVLKALVLVLVFATVISSLFAVNANRHQKETELSLARAESQRLAAEAINVLERGGIPELAALLALRGLDTHYTSQADLALQRAAASYIDSVVIEAPGLPFWPVVSPGNHYLRFARIDPNGSGPPITELWKMQEMERLWQTAEYIIPGYPLDMRNATADFSAVVAATLDDSEGLLLDVKTGERVLTFEGNESPFVFAQLSADGKVLVSGARDGNVHVWNKETGEEIRRFNVGGEGYAREIGRELLVAVSPDSRQVVATTASLTHVWDIESGEELYRFEHERQGYLNPPQFTDDGRLLLVAVQPAVSLWDLSTGQEVEHGIPPGEVGIISPDGLIYAEGLVGDLEQEVVLWVVATGRELHRLTGHSDGARPVAFTDGGRQLVTLGWEGTARIWDVSSGRELLVLAAHTDAIEDAALSPDERFLVTTGQDGTVRIWDLQLPRRDYRLNGVSKVLHLSPDDRVALTVDPEMGTAVLVEADSYVVRHHLDFTPDPVLDGSRARPPFSSDGQLVLGASESGTILVYEVANGELIGEHASPDDVYKHPVFVPGSQSIFAGGDRGAYLLDAESGKRLRLFDEPDDNINYNPYADLVAVSADGRYGVMHEVTGDSRYIVYVWDLETGSLKFQSPPHPNDWTVAFAFSKNNSYFAWGGTGNIVYVLDLLSGEEVLRLSHLDSVHQIDFSLDNRLLLTSTGGDGVILWDLESGEVMRRFFAGDGQAGFVRFVEDDAFALYATFEDGVIHRQPVEIDGLIESMCAKIQRDLSPEQRQIYELDDSTTCPKFEVQ